MDKNEAGKNTNNEEENLPIGRYRDVIYSEALADGEDLEALERAEEAERRQKLL